MLYLTKGTDRLGRVQDKNTVSDFDEEERNRLASVNLSVLPIEYKGTKINLLDTPGMFDFLGELPAAIRAVETALIVEGAGHGYSVGAAKAFKEAAVRKLAVVFAVTRCDIENHDFYKTLSAIQEAHGTKVCPVVVPIVEGDAVTGYVDFTQNKAFTYDKAGKPSEVAVPDDDRISELYEAFKEAVAGADEALMEKFFEGEEFTQEELQSGLKTGVAAGDLYPVVACAGYTLAGVDLLLDLIVAAAPTPIVPAGGVAAICFKSVADPQGKKSFFKVVSGELTPATPAYNVRTGESERMGKIITVKGGKQEDAPSIPAGDIGVVIKLTSFKTGDTLAAPKAEALPGIAFPLASLSMAVKPKKKGEEEKVASAMVRILEEDPSLTFVNNTETHEMVLSGLGEQHLDVVVQKLKKKYGVEVELSVPRVAYRETIRQKVEAQGKHKKQSGGHGQFGDVHIRFEPTDEDFVFAEEVVGGVVPKQYFPAVEKGLRECIAAGFLAGYPMVGLKATLYFGSYHPVDSSEMAFKTAAHLSFKNAMPGAKPTILEPIGTLTVFMPDDNLGDIMGDITKRRGRVLGMGAAEEPKMQKLEAEVPMAEMGDFAVALRSVTQGRGWYSIEFARYEDAPAPVAAKVIEEAKKRQAEAEK
jgi:elongation factor G